MNLNIDAPFNSLSLGNISFGITKELFNKKIDLQIFPKMNNADLAAFDKNCDEFKSFFNININSSIINFNSNIPTLSIWHISGSQYKLSNKNNFLLTFHETSELTKAEVSILNSFEGIFVTNSYSKNVFEEYGVKSPVHFIRLGVDKSQFYKLDKTYLDESICVWSMIGKCENLRKRTKKTIQAWCEKFANNNEHRLHLFVTNPFFTNEQMNNVFSDIFHGQKPPWNVQIFGYQPFNSLVNDALNATSIFIDMSGGEALSLPSLNAVALGKHAIIHNNTAFKDWANKENSTLIEPTGMIIAHDEIFFNRDSLFNQGSFFDFNKEDFLNGLDVVYNKWKNNKINFDGFKLNESYSYKNGINQILDIIF